jgi:16S rRNA (guanine527-N7)-methyltransferase
MPAALGPDAAFSKLPDLLEEIGIQASQAQLVQFRIHFELLLKWNRRINLTSVRDPGHVLRRHFVESAFVTRVVKFGPGTLVDVGSGAGFPGVPIKILSPQTRVVLVESVHKKVAFLKELAREIPLEVFAGRFEDFRLQAQWVTVRALRLDQATLKQVPRGTTIIAITGDPPPRWETTPVPGSTGRFVAVGST